MSGGKGVDINTLSQAFTFEVSSVLKVYAISISVALILYRWSFFGCFTYRRQECAGSVLCE